MNNKHLFKQFDTELGALSGHFLAMGAQVEQQLKRAISALLKFDPDVINEIIVQEQNIDQQEVEIDEECGWIIATRQPAASDLRFVLAVSKAVAILERAADEVVRIAKLTRRIAEHKKDAMQYNDIAHLGEMAGMIFHQSLAAFAQLDSEAANSLMLQDNAINLEFHQLRDKYITAMSNDPANIHIFLDLISIVKSLERIGDYAKKVGEYIIYVAKGTDVRHQKGR